MRADFDGPDLLVGEIVALRTFDLRADGSLWPVFAADRAWVDGQNQASCRFHEPAGARGCMCGFWAYGSAAALRDQARARNVAVVVACWGRITPGTRGIRAQYARIEAIWLSHRVPVALVKAVSASYPSASIYRDHEVMLAKHPLTAMPSYVPDRRFNPTPARIVPKLVQLLVVAMLLFGLLPGGLYHAHPMLHHVIGEFQLILTYAGLSGVVQYVATRKRNPARARLILLRVLPAVIVLLLWDWAPFTPLTVDLLLRIPAAVWLSRILLSRCVRYLPTPVTPVPKPASD